MERSEVTENIMETPAGSRLSIEESAAIEDSLAFMLDEASQDRDGEEFLSRDDLQSYMSDVMERAGMAVARDVPVAASGDGSPEVVLDLTADWEGRKCVVHLKAEMTPNALDGIPGLLSQLRASGVEGRLYLATDILNGNHLVLGPLTSVVKGLMQQDGVGVILADKLFILICQNHDQLMLEEMPHFIFPPPPPRQAP